MTQAIIDIGSNSMRLTLYEIEGNNFKILFREKQMAALAGYVEDGKLNAEGIESACAGLMSFHSILMALRIKDVKVFATASLRNISNTEQAIALIKAATGFSIEVLSGEEEALLGYAGAMEELHLSSGVFFDIGGASTELVTFDEGKPVDYTSFPIGSLSLYRRFVKKILPGESSSKRLQQEIAKTIDMKEEDLTVRPLIVGVGGTARAVLKLAKSYYKISEDCRSITAEQLNGLCEFLCSGKKDAIDMILRLEADRIHTLIPGLLILQHVFHLYHAEQMVVCKYGVREGYLCQRILTRSTDTHKTEN
jgi:exopolyphosphatase / guanosine-5'-triphosphate,3'-diphosphate pyrophosphatase